MISVGGFGHSGNTALLDFLSDSDDVSPLAFEYSESAIIRSHWGLRAVIRNVQKNEEIVPWRFIEDCLLGIKRQEHLSLKAPTGDDFVRNARVRSYLGFGYDQAVRGFINSIKMSMRSNNKELASAFSYETKQFINKVDFLARRKAGNFSSKILIRNDPAAANIDLLQYTTHELHFAIIRNPFDMMFEWIPYYKWPRSEEGASRFTRQFRNKVVSFLKIYSKLPDDIKESVIIVKFEDFVKSDNYRKLLCERAGVTPPKISRNFIPSVSEKNIGVGKDLNEVEKAFCEKHCFPEYLKLLELTNAM